MRCCLCHWRLGHWHWIQSSLSDRILRVVTSLISQRSQVLGVLLGEGKYCWESRGWLGWKEHVARAHCRRTCSACVSLCLSSLSFSAMPFCLPTAQKPQSHRLWTETSETRSQKTIPSSDGSSQVLVMVTKSPTGSIWFQQPGQTELFVRGLTRVASESLPAWLRKPELVKRAWGGCCRKHISWRWRKLAAVSLSAYSSREIMSTAARV